jgi:hypothetical protein
MEKPEEQQTMLKIAIAADFPKLECIRAGFPKIESRRVLVSQNKSYIYKCMYKLYM